MSIVLGVASNGDVDVSAHDPKSVEEIWLHLRDNTLQNQRMLTFCLTLLFENRMSIACGIITAIIP